MLIKEEEVNKDMVIVFLIMAIIVLCYILIN